MYRKPSQAFRRYLPSLGFQSPGLACLHLPGLYLLFWTCVRPILSPSVEFTALAPLSTHKTHTPTLFIVFSVVQSTAHFPWDILVVGLPLPSENSRGVRRLLEPFPSPPFWPRIHHNISNYKTHLHESLRLGVYSDQAFLGLKVRGMGTLWEGPRAPQVGTPEGKS